MKRWLRVLLCLGATAPVLSSLPTSLLSSVAQAEGRAVRLGPQATVVEDDQGRVSMVDEPTPEPSRGQLIGSALGALAGGVGGMMLYDGQDTVRASVYGSGAPLEDGPASVGEATSERAGGAPPAPSR